VELVDGATARSIAPVLSPAVVGGTWTAGDGQADPRQTTEAFGAAAVRHGAELRQGVVDELLRSGDRVTGVRLGTERVTAEWVVLAAGSWTPALTLRLGFRLPIRVEGLQMLLSDTDPGRLGPTLSAETRPLSLKQLPGGAFLVGGGWPADVDAAAHTCRLRQDSVSGSWRTASELCPALAGRRIRDSWCGLEATTIDGVPLIGPLPGAGGVYLATGFSGHGFQLSPAVGDAVARALGGAGVPALAGLSPERVAGLDAAEIAAFQRGPQAMG
jgi:sarcosine oxidase subunit beta